MMDAIGGYFELADYEEGTFPHNEGVLLNTGRNALEYILRSIGVKCVYLPYYTCGVVLEPLRKLRIPWVFYHINARFEIADAIAPKEGEYIIVNNYFGVKDEYIRTLADKYGDHLIVDCAQALFFAPIPGIKCFYSTRKFVGVADGGVAYIGKPQLNEVPVYGAECTAEHDSHLFKRKEFGAEAGFAEYQENEKKLDGQPIRWMSDTTKMILDHIDYDRVVARRRENYLFLHEAIGKKNSLALPESDTFACPMVYPFMPNTESNLRNRLIDNRVYVARYWPDIKLIDGFEVEYSLAGGIIPIPVDQRYGEGEMRRIVEIINL